MAKQVIGFEATLDGTNVEKSVKSIRQELREAQQSAIALGREFGDFSPQAKAAEEKVAKLKNEVSDLNDRVKALDPDKKFTAFSAALQGVAGGFAGVQGAIGLFGTESAELEKQLLKVQSALALSEGLNSVLAAQDSFKNLGSIIKGNVTKAFGTLKSAIISTGIGALVIGVALLIANFDKVKKVVLNFIPGLAKVGEFVGKLVEKVTDFVGVTSEAERAYEKLKKSTANQNDEIDRQIKLLQAQGGQESKIAELQKKKIDNTIKVTQANKKQTDEDKKNLLDLENEKKVIGLEEQARLKKEAADRKKQRQEEGKQAAAEAKQKADEIKKQTYESDKELTLIKLEGREREKKQLEFEEKEALKAVEGNAIATKNIEDLYVLKRKELNKQFTEEDKKNAQELQDFKNELYVDNITNAEVRAKEESRLALEKKVRDINESKLTEAEKLKAVQDTRDAFKREQDAKDFEAQLVKDAEAIAKTEGDFENDRLILEKQRGLILFNTTLTAEKKKKILEDNQKAIAEIDKKEFESKQSNVKKYSDLIGGFAELAGKQTNTGKALAVAEATINTYLAASQVLSAKSPLYITNPFLRFTSAALTIATGLKNVKTILSVKVPGGGGGAGGSLPSGGAATPTPTQAPIASGVQISQTQSIGTSSVNVANQSAIKAFVVERDITDSQDRIAKIKSAATF